MTKCLDDNALPYIEGAFFDGRKQILTNQTGEVLFTFPSFAKNAVPAFQGKLGDDHQEESVFCINEVKIGRVIQTQQEQVKHID